MDESICAVDGCEQTRRRREWCHAHYARWLVTGDVQAAVPIRRRMTLAERFWTKVDRSGGPDACWPWMGFINALGRGQFNYHWRDDPSAFAHRVAYELTYGHRPELLRHRCDNPCCVNPRHLEPGTQRDNINDMVTRGRSTRGEKNPCARLTESEVRAIRTRHAAGESGYRIAKDIGLSQSHVGDIIRRRRWGHID